MQHLSKYLHVQSIAKYTMKKLKNIIKEGISEREIVHIAEKIMKSKGISSFWYHGVGAFVHVGKRTTISESGKNYNPSETLVDKNDIVTVDLSPDFNTYWGDYARTFIITDGKANDLNTLERSNNDDRYIEGFKVGEDIHKIFMNYIKPEKTFEDVYLHMNEVINQLEYVNLDFAGNLGHTIEFNKDSRRYFEYGNKTTLSEVTFFTFEPHIKHKHSEYGFKREDIYYFRNGKLFIL